LIGGRPIDTVVDDMITYVELRWLVARRKRAGIDDEVESEYFAGEERGRE